MKFAFLTLALLLSPTVWSEEESTESNNQLTLKEPILKNKTEGNIDDDVTNPRLRALSGSKSKWSMSLGLNYSGGTIADPFGRYRPDIYGNPENETFTSMGGSVSGRYRFDKKNSLTLGIGFSYLAPLRDDGNPERDQVNITNPGIGYSRIEKVGMFQLSSGLSYVHGTSVAFKEQDLTGYFSLGTTLLTDFNGSRFNLGMAFSFTGYMYSDELRGTQDLRTTYSLGLYPFFEYEITKMFYFRSVLGFMNYEHVRSDENQGVFNMITAPSYVSTGIGIAISRDVYIYPNVQFLPKDLALDNTNFALSATINIL